MGLCFNDWIEGLLFSTISTSMSSVIIGTNSIYLYMSRILSSFVLLLESVVLDRD